MNEDAVGEEETTDLLDKNQSTVSTRQLQTAAQFYALRPMQPENSYDIPRYLRQDDDALEPNAFATPYSPETQLLSHRHFEDPDAANSQVRAPAQCVFRCPHSTTPGRVLTGSH